MKCKLKDEANTAFHCMFIRYSNSFMSHLTIAFVFFSLQDLYIGADVAFHNFQFILIDADEYAVNYMEKHSADFPQANIQFILPKLKRILEQKYEEIKADFQQHDPGNEGRIPGDIFR